MTLASHSQPLAASNSPTPDPAVFARIAEQLRAQGYIVITDSLPLALLHAIHAQVQNVDTQQFKRAGIGREKDFQVNTAVRGDQILWLDEQETSLRTYFDYMERLRLFLNRELLLGLFDYECHYAYYPENAFYKKHIDAFRGQSTRRLSSVLYLNAHWQQGDGGELLLYDENDEGVLERVSPTFGTMVLFLSDLFPHEVLPTQKPRYSLTGWFRVNGTNSSNLDIPR